MKHLIALTLVLFAAAPLAASPQNHPQTRQQTPANEDWYCSGEGLEAIHGSVFVSLTIKKPQTPDEAVSLEVHPKGKPAFTVASYTNGIYYMNNRANTTVVLVAAGRGGVARVEIDAGNYDQGFNGSIEFSQPLVSFSGVSANKLKCQYSIDGVPVTGL